MAYSILRPEIPALLLAGVCSVACSSSDKKASANDDAGKTCPSAVTTDSKQTDRTACKFEAGSKATESVDITEAARKKLPIQHVIVVMKENRSYDHLFGKLGDGYEGIPDSFSNKDNAGNVVKPFHLATTCVPSDPEHQWAEMHHQVNGGLMDGFVTNAQATSSPPSPDGKFVMGYYEESDIPFYYFLAKTYALSDRHFASVRSGTWADRDYLYDGTSDGVENTASPPPSGFPGPDVKTIFDAMDAAGVSWGVYNDVFPLSLALGWAQDHPGVHPVKDLIDGLSSGNLPSVAFVDGIPNFEDDHPAADLQVGEAWLKKIYDAAVAGPNWESTALFFTYDEGGGFADHVPPPEQDCVARPDNPKDQGFFELGVRIPLVAISPWARRHYVSHVQSEHTSITRFIELLFDLPALTKRDANSDALLDLFDFSCKNDAPIPEAPAAGTGGCTRGGPPADAGAPDAGRDGGAGVTGGNTTHD